MLVRPQTLPCRCLTGDRQPMSIRFPLNKIVEAEWHDITTLNSPWQPAKDAAAECTPITVKTVGYVLEDAPKFLKLAMLQTSCNGGEVGVTAVIPKGCIIRSKVLKGL